MAGPRPIDVMSLSRTLNPTVFESMSHTSTLLNGLNFLRERDYLLDVTIWADGESFKVQNLCFIANFRLTQICNFFSSFFFFAFEIVQQLFLCFNGL